MKRRFLQKRVLSSVQSSSSMHSSSLQKRLIEGKRGYSATTTIIPSHPPKTANNLFREIYLDFSGRLLWMGGWFQSCVHRCLICEKWCWAISSVLTTIAVPFWQNTVLMKCLFGGGGVWGAGAQLLVFARWTLCNGTPNLLTLPCHPDGSKWYFPNPLIFYLGEATRGLLWSADPPVPRDAESGKLNLEINYPLAHPPRKQLNQQATVWINYPLCQAKLP